jgi:hypothetical protein
LKPSNLSNQITSRALLLLFPIPKPTLFGHYGGIKKMGVSPEPEPTPSRVIDAQAGPLPSVLESLFSLSTKLTFVKMSSFWFGHVQVRGQAALE